MSKLIKKAAILSLVLVLLLAASASAFAVTSWSDFWYADDYSTIVNSSAEIESYRTYGEISSGSNAGEVSIEYNYTISIGVNGVEQEGGSGYMTDIDWAYVDSGDIGAYTMEHAYYTFNAYVPTNEGDSYYSPDMVELEYPH